MAVDVSEGNVVKDFRIGGTRIKICDDYCHDKTPESVQTILDRIALRAQKQLYSRREIFSADEREFLAQR